MPIPRPADRLCRRAHDPLKPGGIVVIADRALPATPADERLYRAERLGQAYAGGIARADLKASLECLQADQGAPFVHQQFA